MAELLPFRGLRYQELRVGDVGAVIAPPYDVISPQEQEELYQRSPYNVVRLEYARIEPGDDEHSNRYSRAMTTLAEWLQEGVLAHDNAPCFYVYQQEFSYEGQNYRRRSLLARVRLAEWEEGVVLPHEHTLTPPKEDRLRLLQACRAQFSPVFGLYRDDDGSLARLLADSTGDPAIEATDGRSQRHRLYLITDPSAQASLARLFSNKSLYIADGHHRYETALAYRRERQAQATAWTGDEPENFVMMGLTSVDDPGLLVLPIHRLVRPQPPFELLGRLARRFRIQPLPEDDLAGFRTQLANAGSETTALGMYGASFGGLFLLTLSNAQAVYDLMPADSPSAWRTLDVNILQYGVLAPVLGIKAEDIAAGGVVDFTEDAHEAVQHVQNGLYPLAFLMNPTRPEQVLAVADGGWRMPQKSTFFYPKLAAGLVINHLNI